MNGDDRGNGPEWPISRRPDRIDTSQPSAAEPRPDPEPRRESETRVETRRRGINPIYIAAGGILLLLLVLWLLLGRGSEDQDKLTGAADSNEVAATDPERLCGSKQTYDLIKRELFRRAAQVRGSNQAAFDQLSGYAALRVENPVMVSHDRANESVACSGSLSLDLPPGVAVVGGRRTLTADVDYTVQPAADGSGNVVLLRNADGIISPLATLARTAQADATQSAPAADAEPGNVEPNVPTPPTPLPEPEARPLPAPAPKAEPSETASARPSFNCANARTRGEIAVCRDSGLAALDRQMAAQFGRAMSSGNAQQRALLEQTRTRFLSYRDRCRSDSCVAEAYRGRMREISDISAGRWQPPR